MSYLKGHFLGRARDWYDIFGSALLQNTATDFTQLKAFPVVRNRKNLESQFYAFQQNRDQDPTSFSYDQLKVHKKLGLGMPEEALVDHIFVRLEPQVQDYVEVRNPTTTAQLLEVLAKFEEKYSYKKMQGSKNSGNVERRGCNGVGCLIMTIDRGIGEIRKFYIDRVMAEIIEAKHSSLFCLHWRQSRERLCGH
ncbi:uncharacterized protein TNCV_1527201 [Trichonephila clavipes]|nr:uncharacterized protein TNCV_1527201 [Trichonephila clavipes]